MDILINGAGGNMGRALAELLRRSAGPAGLAGQVDPFVREEGILPALSAFAGHAHCVVDFSSHTGVGPLLDWAIAKHLPVVIGTTGHTEEELSVITAAAEQIPLFLSGNLSLGVAALIALTRQAAELFPEADVEILECHHNRKQDVPSGTALMLADAIRAVRPDAIPLTGRCQNGVRSRREIGIHSLRMGDAIGSHTILFDTGGQIFTLRHEARGRDLYAEGAVAAAAFLMKKKPGLYTMKDLTAERQAGL